VVADEASATDALFERARWLAEANGADLTLVDVIDTAPGELSRLLASLPGGRARTVEDRVLAYHRDRLASLAEPLIRDGLRVQTEVLQGVGFVEVIRHVLKRDNDLVIKCAERAPEMKSLRGPDLHLLRKCPCPVWLLNSAMEPNSRRIMAAVDPDPGDEVRDGLNHTVMELATSLARQDSANIDVVNAWYLQEESTLRHAMIKMPEHEISAILADTERRSAARLDSLMKDFTAFNDITRVVHVKGVPADVLTEHAENERIDTVVMGTLGRTGISGLFIGNTAETVLNRVGCSVLTVKPRGFVSPVKLEEGSGT
jgi:nucleotide-binding universal stress UspA family protein